MNYQKELRKRFSKRLLFSKWNTAQYTQVCLLLLTKMPTNHLDINPNNVLLSDVEAASPSVVVGDLGNGGCLMSQTMARLILLVVMEGYDEVRAQSLPCRAPEVWRGLGCFHASDVWSLGVTVGSRNEQLFLMLTH